MRVFAVSDLHAQPRLLDALDRYLQAHGPDYDLILCCGDIGGKGYRSILDAELGQKKQLQEFVHRFPQIHFILGNDDWMDVPPELSARYLPAMGNTLPIPIHTLEMVRITPFNTNREANENRLEYELNKIPFSLKPSLFVSHTPPHGYLDCVGREDTMGENVGSRALLDHICCHRPLALFCGHIHEGFGHRFIQTRYEETIPIFNCASDPHRRIFKGYDVDLAKMNTDEPWYWPYVEDTR